MTELEEAALTEGQGRALSGHKTASKPIAATPRKRWTALYQPRASDTHTGWRTKQEHIQNDTRNDIQNVGMRNLKPKCPMLSEWITQRKSWLGREDLNLGMAESKSAALPLGYAPKPASERRTRCERLRRGADHSRAPSPDQRPRPCIHAPRAGAKAGARIAPHDLPRAACRYFVCAQARRRPENRAGGRALRRSRRGDRRFGTGRSRALCRRRDRAAQYHGGQIRHTVQGRRGDDAAGLEGGLHGLVTGRLERPRRSDAMGRPGAATGGERRLYRNVEFSLDGVRHRPGAHDGRGRRAGSLRLRRT